MTRSIVKPHAIDPRYSQPRTTIQLATRLVAVPAYRPAPATANSFVSATSVVFTNDQPAVFQTVGAGYHYLAANSGYRNSGTTNITPALATDLKQRTTYPPVVLTNDFTASTTLAPQAQRDADTPDLGYHYDPLDYCWTTLNLTNATLTLTNGVAIGIYGEVGT